MDAVLNLLNKLGWHRVGESKAEGGYEKPVLQYGGWKAMIGQVWVTIWRLEYEGVIAEMESFRTDDLELVECAARGATSGRFADLCAPKGRR